MAFKRKSKTKKPKKSSKKNRDSEWAFEGGVSYDNISTEDPKQYKRIHTQEKDERFRRGRLKVEERKRKQHFVNKMSKRVKFSDVWKSDDGEKDEEPTEQEEEAERQRRSQNPNPLPVLDRLQFFLQHSLSGNDENQDSMSVDDEVSDSDDEEHEHERDNTLESSLLAQMQDKNYDFLVFGKELNKEGGDIDEHDVNDDDHDLIGDEENDNKTSQPQENPYLPWFFQSSVVMDRDKSSLIKELTSRHKPQPLSTVTLPYNHEEKVTLYQARNKSLPEHSLEGIETVQDIPSLYKLWKSKAVTSSSSSGVQLNNFSKEILPKLLTYSDIFIEGRNHINDKLILETLLMHSLFHVVRSRAVVVKHNQRIKQKENLLKKKLGIDNDVIDIDKISESLKNNNNKGKNKKKNSKKTSDDISNTLEQAKDDDVSDEVMKDQGFVRPRLLILTPLRSTAKRVVHQMVRILGENTSVSGLQKFDDEYSDLENNDDVSVDWGEEYYQNHRGSGGSNDFGGRRQPGEKPEDWQALFRGNIDDDFKVGIQINPGHGKGKGGQKGVYVKLFSDFYLSDIIVASPIGLKFVLESRPASTASHPNNIDFLSSIEQVIVHQFDVLAYQNLEHVHDIFHHLNQLPRENHSQTDYSRIRPYFLNGCASYYRQLMITSAFNTPELQSFFREYATSHAGWIRCKKSWNENGVISNVIVPKVKQMFQVIPLSSSTTHMGDNDHDVSMVEVYEDRKFQFFKEKILSKITGLKQSRVLIVIPSYFDFVKVRNEMMKEEMNAAYISEYSRESEISRGRSRFYQGIKDILVYSGRAHFFRRFRIRGAKHVIFYSLPEYPHFYSEIVNMLGDFRSSNHQEGEEQDDDEEKNVAVQDSVRDDDEDYTSVALCSELDQMALERVVGKKRCDHMLQSKKTTFLFF